MKKLLFAFLTIVSLSAFAQTRQGTVEYDKQQVPCFIVDNNMSKDLVEKAIQDKFKKMGVNSTSQKGFIEYRNAIVPEISSTPVDVLIKVQKVDKASSTTYMIVSKPIGSATDPNGSTQSLTEGSMNFLNTLIQNNVDFSLEQDIAKQTELLKNAQKKQTNIIDDGNNLQKKLQNIQNDITDNQKKQQNQADEVKKQQEILNQMIARRRGAVAPKM